MTASLVGQSEIDGLTDPSPGDDLLQRLDDPRIASSLSQILDHADLLATIIAGLDGLLRRAEVIADSMVSGIAEIREVAASTNGQRAWPSLDVTGLSDSVARLSAAAVEAAPAVERLLRSPLTDPQTAEVLAQVGEALLEGREAAVADPRGPKGVFAVMRVVKDPDVSRGLGFMIHIARAFGRRLAPEPTKKQRVPKHAAE
ncbi:DUF1641 domain-containing protein [Mycobacterium xenopi]|uniref:DUF1641 domain-containing protein n=2 Tax=Mycobacterium xenopi TaxID=1789 RepID=A0AAD1GWS7_MYCXE|nr:DUF1641 domain-containing protein [Mycobacterium xenopi]EUA23616.1 hypothetical protein I553_5619 [Mycobacterium xenopi 4042]MDA3641629.1 DUF1641 domain-containing protein [Mycobacterium xenopi]MDA3659387.1 DUF1641 domain-containing protein [Mycobacterium xenopi]MDA3663861.1 DUF1641 domain-containing protein [Mycobacterium xenopi]ORX13464.1 hypothetical protein AWC32_15460 [Mycobacterium xenopi]